MSDYDHTFAEWSRIVRKAVHPAKSINVEIEFLSYPKFVETVGEAPSVDTSLLKIDWDKPYSFENVHWVYHD